MTFNYYNQNSNIGSKSPFDKLSGVHDLVKSSQHAFPKEAFIITALNETEFTIVGGEYRVFLGGGGGGGSSSGRSGGFGGIFWFDLFLPPGSYVAGVGAGGRYTSISSINLYRNSESYPCRGGSGSFGNSAGSGSGGGGSFLRAVETPSTEHWNNYLGIVGGGGGCATHDYTSNYGGHGFGVGGAAWSDYYPGSLNNSFTGRNGFDSTGAGGIPVSGTAANNYGGNANISAQLFGGSASSYSAGHNGGGGGGGAGGGASGAGGDSLRTLGSGAGGYISTSTTVGSYTAVTVPRGGGGGGGHQNDVGGTGGGGGVLLFSRAGFTNSWGTSQGVNVPHYNTSLIASTSKTVYAAWSELSSYSASYLGQNLTTGILSNKCNGANGNNIAGDGFVIVTTRFQVIPLSNITTIS